MTTWIIEPYDPLLVRDGRPFGPNPGARARSLPFPFPSTATGTVRTRAGQDPNGYFHPKFAEAVTAVHVRGPLPVELVDGEWRYLAPAPRDALAFEENDGTLTVRPLTPLELEPGISRDLDGQNKTKELHLVGLTVRGELRKPTRKAPAFWRWAQFAAWLAAPETWSKAAAELGWPTLLTDRRMHVSIDPTTGTGRDGMLFMTGGLSFHHTRQAEEPNMTESRRLALAVAVVVPDRFTIAPGWAPMGGERRLMTWHPDGPDLPPMLPDLQQTIVDAKRCRVVLLTPAAFDDGWRPRWLLEARAGVKVGLEAAAVGKPETVSGWDMVAGGPRPSRRLVPAGSVYYLKLDGQPDDIRRWLAEIWMQCISDNDNDQAAGFGLAVVGAYDGPQPITTEEAQDAEAT